MVRNANDQPMPAGRKCIALALLLLAAVALAGCVAPPAYTPTPAQPAQTVTPATPTPTPTASPTRIEPTATAPVASPTQTPRQVREAAAEPTATPPAPTQTPEQRPRAKRVLIISVDGLRPDALSGTVSPNIMALAEAGAYTWHAQTVLPSVTLISHASMLSGVGPERHGITWNDYRPDQGTIKVPTVFSVAHAAGLHTTMVFGKTKLLHLAAPGAVDDVVNLTGHGDSDIGRRATELIPDSFGVMFVHLPSVDGAGHATGWMSPPYLSAVTQADEAIGRMLDALGSAGLAETTAVIVTADHGGLAFSHGRDIPEDRTIPWVIAGQGVRAGHELTTKVSTMDTAATALFALGLEVPAEWEGRPVREAFDE